MKVTIGEDGLSKSWQDDFPETTICVRCGGVARIGFVAHEGIDRSLKDTLDVDDDVGKRVCDIHVNGGKGDFWLHNRASFAIYLCKCCLEPTALYNQG